MNYLWQKFLVELNDHHQSALDEFSIIYCGSASSIFFRMGYPEEMLSFARHTNLCIHNSESYMFLELFLLSCILTLVCQLIVKSMRAFVYRCLLLLWSVKPFCPEWLGETNSRTDPYPGLGQRSCAPQIKLLIQPLILFYLGVLPPLCQNCHENCTNSHEFWCSDTSHHH